MPHKKTEPIAFLQWLSFFLFCILKTTSSAGGSKKLPLCPDY
jgi:hypothetical protein